MRKQRSIRSPRLGQDRFLSEQQPRRSPAAPWSPFTARYGLSVALDGRLRRIPDHAGPMPHPYADARVPRCPTGQLQGPPTHRPRPRASSGRIRKAVQTQDQGPVLAPDVARLGPSTLSNNRTRRPRTTAGRSRRTSAGIRHRVRQPPGEQAGTYQARAESEGRSDQYQCSHKINFAIIGCAVTKCPPGAGSSRTLRPPPARNPWPRRSGGALESKKYAHLLF